MAWLVQRVHAAGVTEDAECLRRAAPSASVRSLRQDVTHLCSVVGTPTAWTTVAVLPFFSEAGGCTTATKRRSVCFPQPTSHTHAAAPVVRTGSQPRSLPAQPEGPWHHFPPCQPNPPTRRQARFSLPAGPARVERGRARAPKGPPPPPPAFPQRKSTPKTFVSKDGWEAAERKEGGHGRVPRRLQRQ